VGALLRRMQDVLPSAGVNLFRNEVNRLLEVTAAG
jgi:hypothetical protein